MTHPAAESDRPPSNAGSKSVLYCYECGHESPVEGDWIVRVSRDCISYTCPDCETTITSRPRSGARVSDEAASRCFCTGD